VTLSTVQPGSDDDGAVIPPGAGGSGPPVRHPASFRDPGGFVFLRDGILYRQVNHVFRAEWKSVVETGLLRRWQDDGRYIGHDDVEVGLAADPKIAYAVLRPKPVGFVSYPYEWTFGELRDAALLTLDLQDDAQRHGFTLRDASAYNIQFDSGRPVLIDSLSVAPLERDAPWAAYRQFCQHFIAPLALMAHRDVRCGLMLRDHADGIPLDLASALLPGRTYLSPGLAAHIHLHARSQRRLSNATPVPRHTPSLGATRRAALIDSLRRTVQGLRWNPDRTEWADYDRQTSYSDEGARAKESIVGTMLRDTDGSVVWDLGANIGRFSAIAARLGRRVVAWDSDPGASERHYRALRKAGEARILPLVQDITNPSPGLGWGGAARAAFVDRSNADVVLALALVHHLAIGKNVPLDSVASLFARLAPRAIVEFVPKEDPMVGRMLASRRDIFADYTRNGFERAFEARYRILERQPIQDSTRMLYRLERR